MSELSLEQRPPGSQSFWSGRASIALQNRRAALRAVISAATAAVTGIAVWGRADGPLSVHTDVVGRTTWANFNVYRYLYHFYEATIILPAIALGTFYALSRWGPLAFDRRRQGLTPVVPRVASDIILERPSSPTSDVGRVAGSLLRLVPTMGVAYVAAAIASEAPTWSAIGVASAAGFAAGLTLLATLFARFIRRSQPGAFNLCLSWLNLLATAALPLTLALVSTNTEVIVQADHRIVHFRWFPLWLGLVATVAAFAYFLLRVRRSSNPEAVQDLERQSLIFIVGPILLFLLTAVLPGELGQLNGFDDAQAIVGANLMFHHGLWPWRDILLLHGFLDDGLYGQLGLWVLSPSAWGARAGELLIVIPLSYVALYLFTAYFARRRGIILAVAVLTLAFAPVASYLSSRYLLVLAVLVLFDRLIRHGTWARCWIFMGACVFTSIVSPEATILVLGVLAVLVVSDVVRWRYGESPSKAFIRTLRCLFTGISVGAVWVVFLTIAGGVGGFISYYRGTISGHELWGAFPLVEFRWEFTQYYAFALLPVVLFLLTLFRMARLLFRRQQVTPRDWAMAAAATFVPLFYQVFLDRPDIGHVEEMYAAATPLVFLWAIHLIERANDGISFVLQRVRSLVAPGQVRGRPMWQVATWLALVGVTIWSTREVNTLRLSAARFQPVVSAEPTPAVPLGYSIPNATNIPQILDLRSVLKTYVGTHGAVFDFVNEMGIPYFLLDYVPGARYYHVEAAQTLSAQQDEIRDLTRSRPRAVIYFDTTFGLPYYDGIISSVRNYLVSQYILDHYSPIIDVDGQLILIRSDLVGSVPVSQIPGTHSVVSDLYFQMPACNWGDTPNFLDFPSSRELAVAQRSSLSQISRGLYQFSIPPGTTWSSFRWIRITSTTPFGTRNVDITDDPTQSSNHDIKFGILPRSGGTVFVRVGSCIQWHGYRAGALNLHLDGDARDLAVSLLP